MGSSIIKPTDEEKPSMVIEKSSKSNSEDKASNLAKNIEYTYHLDNNVLQLEDHFFLYNSKQNNHAAIRIYLNLPREMVFTMDQKLARKSSKNHRNDRLVPEEYLQVINEAIVCVSCPIEQEKPKETKPTSDWEQRVEKAFEKQN